MDFLMIRLLRKRVFFSEFRRLEPVARLSVAATPFRRDFGPKSAVSGPDAPHRAGSGQTPALRPRPA